LAQLSSTLIWKKSEPKVFNWSEFHFSDKIHTLVGFSDITGVSGISYLSLKNSKQVLKKESRE
jgi:hypothetical protein